MTLRSQDIRLAAEILTKGSLVAIPTETVYGMAANAFDINAVKNIFLVKNRPFYDPLILHTDSVGKIESWGMALPISLKTLADKFWPGPLTILLNRSSQVDELITAGLPRVAFRIPNHPMTLDLLRQLPFPLAAPSANPFGYVSPTNADHVWKHFNGKIDMVLDGGPCSVGLESTIVGEEDGEIVVYRLGGLSIEEIESVVGAVCVRTSSSKPAAPGMLEKHYSPNKKVVAVDAQPDLMLVATTNDAFILRHLSAPEFIPQDQVFRLGAGDDDHAAARDFYNALQSWDHRNDIQRIVVERMPGYGLGRAINDRLRRAINS